MASHHKRVCIVSCKQAMTRQTDEFEKGIHAASVSATQAVGLPVKRACPALGYYNA